MFDKEELKNMGQENDQQIALPIPLAPNGRGASNATDPTYNVRMLMDANSSALKELTQVRIDNLEDVMKIHVSYQEKLALSDEKLVIAEAKRIDAILLAGANAAITDRERAAETAQILANQVITSAERVRAEVASTAAAQAASSAASTIQLNERLFNLEKARYTDQGSSLVKDPIFADLTKKVESIVTAMSKGEGKGIGANALWGYIVGGLGALAIILGLLNIY